MKLSFKGIAKEQELKREKELEIKDTEIHQKMVEVMETEETILLSALKTQVKSDEYAEVDKVLKH